MKHVIDVVRIQTVNWIGLLAWPVAILGLTFVINFTLFGLLGNQTSTDNRTTGALISIYIVMAISHLQSITQVFPFAMGLSVTRRTFYAATALVVAGQAAIFGVALTLFMLLEQLTNGWGISMRFFSLPFLVQDNLVLQFLVFTVPFIALSAIGVFGGVVFKRWGQSGVYVMGIGASLVVFAAVVLITLGQLWPAVGSFFATTPTVALLAGYPLLIAVVLGAGGYLAIRRAVP
ncbi:hypothetical protein [Pseudonocardia sp. TRM90224]|uniref:hypothetical protein n=1 Tax=Pseudonocardia sp. TRM90224 TaxID=2812678 RepID=UPI001E50253B|nr:hypothetical protein [Pseudonocardia sp. TRM90224]